nr:transglycosylase domain-containing protein [Kibdelosporangium phytohabitans]
MIGPIIAFFIAYQLVDVPNPEKLADQLDKTVTVTYADDSPFTTVAPQGRRTLVKYDQIPKDVLHAVYASEDATFETNDGFDLMGIAGAVWNNLTGGTGGGSTITQQYVKKATGNEDPTLTRKALELVTAYKLSNTTDKNDIITGYLNTVYFGKRAYGIAAAAKAYYNKDLDKITKSEAAVLAGVIQTPSRASNDNDYVKSRWEYVTNKMIENKWMTPQEKAEQPFPEPVPVQEGSGQMTPDMQFLWQQAKRELDAQGIKEDEINKNGYKIQLTIDPGAQKAAAAAADKIMQGQPENLRKALVAVDPQTGRVIAYYGYNQGTNATDYARGWYNPGSSFKPFDLVALLHEGKGLGQTYDGRSGRKFGGATINNSEGNDSCGEQCTVAKAMEMSINTVFAEIAFKEVGYPAVAKAAIEAGIPKNIGRAGTPLEGDKDNPLDLNIAIGGGRYVARPIDMAGAYATFAANGNKRTPHVVAKVTNPNDGDRVVWDGDKNLGNATLAFNKSDPGDNAKIARNVTESLIPVINTTKNGKYKCEGGHECAGKTGTHNCAKTAKTTSADNCAAWMVGYTPQISTAVWVGSDDNSALRDKKRGAVYGSGLPAEIWKEFMDSYLKGKDAKDFGKFTPIGKSPQQAEAESRAAEERKNASSSANNTPSTNTQTQQPPATNTTTTETTTTTTRRPGGGGPGGPGGTNPPGCPGRPGCPTGEPSNPDDLIGSHG